MKPVDNQSIALLEKPDSVKENGPETLRQQRPALTSTPISEVRMLRKHIPSADEIRQLVDYDLGTGKFTWRPRGQQAGEFDQRYAGKPALSTADRHGYHLGDLPLVGKGKVQVRAHQAAWLFVTGEWPKGEIDHINGDRADNRFVNLRLASRVENMRNKALHKTNKSGAHGVLWVERERKWVVTIGVNGRNKVLGRFVDLDEAIAVRKGAERELGFHPNHGRTCDA